MLCLILDAMRNGESPFDSTKNDGILEEESNTTKPQTKKKQMPTKSERNTKRNRTVI